MSIAGEQSETLNLGTLPPGWTEAAVTDLVAIIRGVSYAKGEAAFRPEPGRVALLRANNIGDGLNFHDLQYVPGSRVAPEQMLRPGDVVIAMSSGSKSVVGKAASLTTKWTGTFGAFCGVLRPHPGLDPAYVGLFFRTKEYRSLISGASAGTNINNLKREYFDAIRVPVPPLPEQKRIAAKVEEVLARVNTARERLAKLPAILKRFRQSVLAAACSGRLTADWREEHHEVESVDPSFSRLQNQRVTEHEAAVAAARRRGERAPRKPAYLEDVEEDGIDLPAIPELPESWKLLRVEDAAVVMQYGTSVKADASADKGLPMLRMGNVQDGRIDLSDLKYMDPNSDDVESFLLNPGDIVFNRTNSPELVGKSAVFDVDRRVVFASYLVRLKCDPRLIQSDFVCNWINSLWGRAWARAVRTDGVSQSNINATKLGAMPLPVPPLEEQVVIGQRVRRMFDLADKIEKRVSSGTLRADKLVQAMLAKAFRGELVPTEAELAEREGREYETAEALLDRIHRERTDAHERPAARRRRSNSRA